MGAEHTFFLCPLSLHDVSFVRREKRLSRAGEGLLDRGCNRCAGDHVRSVVHLIDVGCWAALFVVRGEFSELGTAYTL